MFETCKNLIKSAITREDYAKDPQTVLEVLEFYTGHKKREMEELGLHHNSRQGSGPSPSTMPPSTLSPHTRTSSAPRFNAGTGLGGIGKPEGYPNHTTRQWSVYPISLSLSGNNTRYPPQLPPTISPRQVDLLSQSTDALAAPSHSKPFCSPRSSAEGSTDYTPSSSDLRASLV
jgi:hypothetical protein